MARNGSARASDEPSGTTTAFSIPRDLLDEVERAAFAVYRNNRSFLICDAIERHLSHLRKLYNGNRPFSGPRRPARRRNRSL